jgi:hypothetical protein
MKTDLDNGKLKSGPYLSLTTDVLLMAGQGLLLGGALFALFCLTLELERLGHALESDHQG